jgi:outer membrane receptor for ferrienterochelin and colicin
MHDLRAYVIVIGLVMTFGSALSAAIAAITVTGTVRDASGAPVPAAEVALLTPELTGIARTATDGEGRFTLAIPAPGTFLLIVRAKAFDEVQHAFTAVAGLPSSIDIVIQPAGLREEVTVTASRGTVEELRRAGQAVNVVDEREIGARVKTVVAQAIEGEAGVHLQRTSPTMAGIFVRGLTGNKINVFVDGVRFSNGAQRGGVNTFLDLIEAESLETIEVLRGPSSAQYGSDALGGSVQFLSRAPSLGVEGGPRWRGSTSVDAGSAHVNGGGSLLVGYMGKSVGLTASVAGRKAGRVRTGRGIDSHAAVTRFFGMPSNALMSERLPDTGFEQYGTSVRSNWIPDARTHLVAGYMRTLQDNGNRYDQLLGGDGNRIAQLNGLSLDLFSLRAERLEAGWFDDVSATYSLNSQREERVNQGGNGNPAATIGHEPERTTVHGVQIGLSRQLSPRQSFRVGGDVNFERLTSKAFNVNPVTGATTARRPRIPDGATFTQGGVYAQTTLDVRPERFRLAGALRYGGAHYEASAAPLWPGDSLATSSLTFRAAGVLTPAKPWTVVLTLSRGFRAPHMTDLGTLGLTGSGFEVAAPDVAGLAAFVGTTADAAALSSGEAVRQVGPETSLQYEATFRYRQPRVHSELSLFVNNVYDNIQKQTLILPQGSVGLTLGGSPIVSQNVNGAVFVAATTTPVLVRANVDNARIWGIEHSAEAQIFERVTVNTSFTYLRAKDTTTGLPPNIEGGTPAPEAWVSGRWTRADGRWSLEPYAHVAWKQPHLSSLDAGDRRTGAERSRGSIRAFFLNGATSRGWVSAGADNVLGTADDRLTATGETLAQIQDRVLGPGVNASSLFREIPGYGAIGVRAVFRTGGHQVTIDAENLTDANYRGVSWGIDAPGRGVTVKYQRRWSPRR